MNSMELEQEFVNAWYDEKYDENTDTSKNADEDSYSTTEE